METYQYNHLVTGLPQHQIEDKLRTRRTSEEPGSTPTPLLGEVAMTMGLQLRRGYVNSLAVLDDGTLVCALDDGHIQMWRRGQLVNDLYHEKFHGQDGGVDQVINLTTPSSAVDGPAFATGGRGGIRVWTRDGTSLMSSPCPSGTSPASLAMGTIDMSDGDDEETINGSRKFLAVCVKVTYQSNPNQFRLVPQDEAGRQRRAAAQEQERLTQEHLLRASQCVRMWTYDDQGGRMGFGNGMIEPSSGRESPPVTELAVVDGKLVCGDEWGGMRTFKWSKGNNNANGLQPRQDHSLQFRCPEFHCTISCMEPIQGNLLAVATNAYQSMTQGGVRVITSAKPLQVTIPRAVFIVDLTNDSIRAVLNAHSDVVNCICPIPTGGLLTGGGKMDATIRVWESSAIQEDKQASSNEEDVPVPVLTEAKKLKELGYVFDLKVLPDSEPDSNLFAIAGARYNTVKIVI